MVFPQLIHNWHLELRRYLQSTFNHTQQLRGNDDLRRSDQVCSGVFIFEPFHSVHATSTGFWKVVGIPPRRSVVYVSDIGILDIVTVLTCGSGLNTKITTQRSLPVLRTETWSKISEPAYPNDTFMTISWIQRIDTVIKKDLFTPLLSRVVYLSPVTLFRFTAHCSLHCVRIHATIAYHSQNQKTSCTYFLFPAYVGCVCIQDGGAEIVFCLPFTNFLRIE